MQQKRDSNHLDLWTVTIPAHIVRSFQQSQVWRCERTELLAQNTVATVLRDEFVEYTFIQNAHLADGADETIYYQCYQKTSEYLEVVISPVISAPEVSSLVWLNVFSYTICGSSQDPPSTFVRLSFSS